MINNKINTNHLLITKNKNSILIKIIPTNITKNYTNSHYLNNKTNALNQMKNYSKIEQSIDPTILFRYRFIIGVFELIIKGISRDEIDLFRGQYFYILLDPKIFVGYYYLFILFLLSMRIFYELNDDINYQNLKKLNGYPFLNNKKIRKGRIISGLLILSTISILLLLHIEYIIKIVKFDNIHVYYLVIIFIMIFQILTLILFKLNKKEENFINELLMFIITLNCWNFILSI